MFLQTGGNSSPGEEKLMMTGEICEGDVAKIIAEGVICRNADCVIFCIYLISDPSRISTSVAFE